MQDFLKVSNNLFLDGTIYVTSRTQKAATRWQVSKKDNFDIQYSGFKHGQSVSPFFLAYEYYTLLRHRLNINKRLFL